VRPRERLAINLPVLAIRRLGSTVSRGSRLKEAGMSQRNRTPGDDNPDLPGPVDPEADEPKLRTPSTSDPQLVRLCQCQTPRLGSRSREPPSRGPTRIQPLAE
jgi:hypothetical protein